MPDLIEIRINPPDLFKRMARYPKKLDQEMEEAGQRTLLYIHSQVDSYPPARSIPSGRSGSLGRTIGSEVVDPDPKARATDTQADKVRKIKRLGQGRYEIRFGTRIHYAPDVIGEGTQLPRFKALGWWNMGELRDKVENGINKIYQNMAAKLVDFLGG